MQPSHRTALALVLLNLVLKWCWLGVNELAHDEPFTMYWALRPIGALWTMLGTENNPPLYFLLMKAWGMLVPLDAAWWRIPSATFSALAVWPLYLLTRQLGGARIALVAALLFTFSNYHYGFAHEVRAYALFTLLSVTSMWLLLRNSEGRMRPWIWLAVVNVLLVYTHFFGWFVIGLQGLCMVLPELRTKWRTYLIALGIAVASYLPYAAIFLSRMGHSMQAGTWLDPPVPEELYNMIWRWSNAPVLAVGFLVVIAVALWRTRAKDLGMRLGLLWTFVPLLGMFAVSFAVPMFLDRYLVYAAPGFTLLVAFALSEVFVDQRMTNVLAFGAVIGMALTVQPWQDNGRHPSKVVAQVEAWSVPQQTVLILPDHYDLTFAYHWDKGSFLSETSIPAQLAAHHIHPVAGVVPEQDVHGEQLILILSGEDRPAVLGSLRARYGTVDAVEADHKVWVYLFRK